MRELMSYKSKKLNTASFGGFTHNDYQTFLHLISKIPKVDINGDYIKPDKLQREYILTAKEYNDIFNCDMKNAYAFLRKASKKLMKTSVVVEKMDLNQTWEINICSHAVYNDKEGSITIMFTDSIMPYLAQVREKFVVYNLKEISNFGSLYSTRLYELIQEFKDTGFFIKSTQQLRDIFVVGDKYKKYNDFKRKTFGHAIKEINSMYQIDLQVEEIKQGRKITTLKFTFNKTRIVKRFNPKTGDYTNEYIKPERKETTRNKQTKDIVLEGQMKFEDVRDKNHISNKLGKYR
jgi:plasmid replication initiation protein